MQLLIYYVIFSNHSEPRNLTEDCFIHCPSCKWALWHKVGLCTAYLSVPAGSCESLPPSSLPSQTTTININTVSNTDKLKLDAKNIQWVSEVPCAVAWTVELQDNGAGILAYSFPLSKMSAGDNSWFVGAAPWWKSVNIAQSLTSQPSLVGTSLFWYCSPPKSLTGDNEHGRRTCIFQYNRLKLISINSSLYSDTVMPGNLCLTIIT